MLGGVLKVCKLKVPTFASSPPTGVDSFDRIVPAAITTSSLIFTASASAAATSGTTNTAGSRRAHAQSAAASALACHCPLCGDNSSKHWSDDAITEAERSVILDKKPSRETDCSASLVQSGSSSLLNQNQNNNNNRASTAGNQQDRAYATDREKKTNKRKDVNNNTTTSNTNTTSTSKRDSIADGEYLPPHSKPAQQQGREKRSKTSHAPTTTATTTSTAETAASTTVAVVASHPSATGASASEHPIDLTGDDNYFVDNYLKNQTQTQPDAHAEVSAEMELDTSFAVDENSHLDTCQGDMRNGHYDDAISLNHDNGVAFSHSDGIGISRASSNSFTALQSSQAFSDQSGKK